MRSDGEVTRGRQAIAVRPERAGDAAAVETIVRGTYEDVPYSDHREYLMVERLRETDAFVPDLSLIAEVDGGPAGHVLLTRAWIEDGIARTETLAMAPLSVLPPHRGLGVGRVLIEAAHERASALGFGSIVVVGVPDYFPRFGYQPLSQYPIRLPFCAPAANCMILPLRPQALAGTAGTVAYAPDWLTH